MRDGGGPLRFGGLRGERSVFACGADLKNRFSLFAGGAMRFSSECGDLAVPGNLAKAMDAARRMKDTLRAAPSVVAHDLHPGYFSARLGNIFPGVPRLAVQHHHAHVASVLAQHEFGEPAIGVAFDGTGYGTDGAIWGGEFLIVSPRGWSRRAHFDYMRMPGGEAAIREPWRMAFGLLCRHLGENVFGSGIALLRYRPEQELRVMKNALDAGVNAPLTSSCGRLFDAVSALLGIVGVAAFDAEAAMRLEEKAAASDDCGAYRFDITRDAEHLIGCGSMLSEMLRDMKRGTPVEHIARRFHNGLAALIAEMAGVLARESGARAAAFSGGVFLNRILRVEASRRLRDAGLRILESTEAPVSDLGICVGQTWVALRTVPGMPSSKATTNVPV